MLNRLMQVLFYIFSLSCILCISDDSNFGTIESYNKGDWKEFRYSLLSFYLGSKKYYFLTIKKESYGISIKCAHKMYLNELNNIENIDKYEEQLEQTLDNYKRYVSENYRDISGILNEDKVDSDKEFILYKISQHQRRKDISNNKVNIYNAIMIAMLPIIITFLGSDYLNSINFYMKAIWIIILYFIFNILCLVFDFSRVTITSRSKFSDIKFSNSKKLASLYNLYYEFQAIQKEADLNVSYVKNMDFYIKNIFFMLILIVILTFMGVDNQSTTVLDRDKDINYNKLIYLDLNELAKGKEEALNTVQYINNDIINSENLKINIFYKDRSTLDNEIFINLKNQMYIFNKEIDFILIEDKDIDNINDIKILMQE